MTEALSTLTRVAQEESARSGDSLRRLFWVGVRYGLSALGPVSVSGAHFVASLIFLRAFSAVEFGQFAFLLVIVPFCLSMSGALLAASVAARLGKVKELGDDELSMHLKMNLVFAGMAGIGVAALMTFSGTPWPVVAAMAIYGAAMTVRWFARAFAYLHNDAARPITSDLIYALLLVGGLTVLWCTGALTAETGALILLIAAAASLLGFGKSFLVRQFVQRGNGSISAYGPIWRELTRWSALGVVMTEMAGNAHAYLVTFLSGPQSFALLALGALFMRPASLVLSALPDMERPVMARAIANGDLSAAFRTVKEFRTAAGAVWLATIVLAGAILFFEPQLILKDTYALGDVAVVLGFWAAIQGIRTLRTPASVLLQAAGELKGLARASGLSAIVSLIATAALLIAFGPLAALGGVLLGDIVMLADIHFLTRKWVRNHA